MDFKDKNIISIDDLSKEDLLKLIEVGEVMEKDGNSELMKGKMLGSLFFEPSTRTRLSFEAAMMRLGGNVVGFADSGTTSIKKGESIHDTIKMVEHYCDVIVIRHPTEGTAQIAADATELPVINAGDGINQHPTQTMVDLFTIKKTQGKIDGVKVAFVGDLKYGRTVHSLSIALSHFDDVEQFFVSPNSLKMPKSYFDRLTKAGVKFSEHEKIEDVLDKVDILYMTRIQQERFPTKQEYEKMKGVFHLKKSMLGNVKDNMRILHPLPRVDEISEDVDDTPHAYYFQQAGLAVPVREALLALVLGKAK
ncbi:aspartate carbamoyltransferase [Nanoarchaeota archaeon]